MAGRCNPCRAMNVEAHILWWCEQRLACMDAHAHAKLCPLWPGVRRKRTLSSHCGLDRQPGFGKRNEERVAFVVDLVAPVAAERITKKSAVFREGISVRLWAQLAQKPGRAFYVSEKKSDSAARLTRHVTTMALTSISG